MKKIPWAFFLIIGLFIVYFFAFISPSIRNSSDTFAEGQTVMEQGEPSNPFRADISIVPPNLDDKYQNVSLELHKANFFVGINDYDKRIATVCIDSMAVITRFKSSLGGEGGEQVSRFFDDQKGICEPLNTTEPPSFVYADIFGKTNEQKPIYGEAYMDNNSYYYPYDGFTYESAVYLKYRYLDEKGNILEKGVISPYVTTSNEGDIDWDRVVSTSDSSFSDTYWWLQDDEYLKYAKSNPIIPQKVTYSRPLVKRIIYPILLLSLLIFIAFLTTTNDFIAFVEGASAILFGIYGIREVIVPSITTANRTTIIDSSILGLYLVLSFATAIQLLKFFKTQFQQYHTNALDTKEKEIEKSDKPTEKNVSENIEIKSMNKSTPKQTKSKGRRKK